MVDPEIRVLTIDDLGILREVARTGDGRVVVTITPTYTGCPAMDVIRADIRRALAAAGYPDAEVRTVCARPGRTDWISDSGRAKLAAAGIAPPAAGPRRRVVPLTLAVRCPRCGSPETEQLSPVRLHRVQGAVALPLLRRTLRPREGAVTVTIREPVRRRPALPPAARHRRRPAHRRRRGGHLRRTGGAAGDVRVLAPASTSPCAASPDGEDVRRSYSICSTPADLARHGRLRIGVQEIPGGAFSAFACGALRGGDTVEVLPPLGHFTTAFAPDRARHYGAVVAGSGITPVLALVATGAGRRAGEHLHPGVRQPHGRAR